MRYKYSQNLTEASEMTFAENEYQGVEQTGTMKRIPTTTVKEGIHNAQHDHVDFATNPLADTNTVGRLIWNDDAKTLSIVRDNTGGTKVSVEIGDEIQVRVKNTTGSTILNGQPVYTASALGNTPLIALADGDDPSKNRVTGLMTADIANNGVSYLTTVGLVRDVPIANIIDPADVSWTVGIYLYLSTVTGKLTKNRPSVDIAVRVGIITDISGSNCTILVYLRDDYAKIFTDIDNAITALKGVDYTDGTLKTHEDRLDTLEGDDTVVGSVSKTVKDAAQDATYDNTGTGIEAGTLKTAITELDARLVDAEAHVYGLDFNETTGVCTRLLDAVGLTVGAPDGVNPIVSDFDSCYPWSAMHHVKIALDGTRKEPFEDGYDTFDGEMMRHTPAYWYKDYRSGGHRYLYISDKKKAGFLYQKAYDIASFDASKVGTEYRSRVGEAPKTLESYTQFITGFYAQGDGQWSMYDQLHSEFMLSVIEAGTLNHKAAYGRGINSGMPYGSTAVYLLTADTVNGNDVVLADSAQPFYVGMIVQIGTTYTNNSVAQDRLITNVVRAGGVLTLTLDGAPFSAVIGNSCVTWGQSVPQAQFDTIGDGSGYILQHESVNRSHVCYRGVWDLWGNIWQFYAGFMRYNGRYYGCTDPTKYKITNPVGADGWVDLGVGEYAENGYQQIREGVVIDGGTIDVPITWGSVASSETYYSAYLYNFNSSYTGVRVLRLGGYWSSGSDVSLVFSNGYGSPSDADFYIGSRLIRS